MKKKSNGMSPDMFHDATPSTPIPVFITNEETKNESQNATNSNSNQTELIPINWENRTVSARALYGYFAPTERFSTWCKRYFAHGFVENIDFTPIEFFVTLNRTGKRDYGDFLLALNMAKSIAMMQRSEKGIQAYNYFTDMEKQGVDEKKFDKKSSIQENNISPIAHPTSKGDSYQNELIKIDFDKQTVSARMLYNFLELTERFSKWCNRMFSYGLVENVDFTAVPNGTLTVPFGTVNVPFGTAVNNFTSTVPFGTVDVKLFTPINTNELEEIDDYLLTIDAAKHIAMVQRNEKGKQARNYFINIEKLYWKKQYSNHQTETPISLLENLNNIIGQLDNFKDSIEKLEMKNVQQQQLQKTNDSLVEKTIVLEKKLVELSNFYNLKDEYIERTISKKIDIALKSTYREAEQINVGDELVKILPRAVNQKPVIVLNQLEKNLQKTTLEEDLIRKCYRPAERKTENAIFLTATEITHRLEPLSKKVMIRNVGMALKKLGFERVYSVTDDKATKGYFVIQI